MACELIPVARPTLKVSAETYSEDYQELQNFRNVALIKGVDYGTLGDAANGKDILFLPGAEKLADAYGLAAGAPELLHIVEGWDTEIPFFHYVVRIPFLDRGTGVVVGYGIGSCNSMEIKYRYRTDKVWVNKPADANAPPDESGDWKLVTTKRSKSWQKKVMNPETPDLANTILKMGAKRSYVDGVLKILRASALFTQDIEDMPKHLIGGGAAEEAKEIKEFYCTQPGCGVQIVDATIGKTKRTAEEIATLTVQQFGQALCPKCWNVAIKARKESEGTGTPAQIQEVSANQKAA